MSANVVTTYRYWIAYWYGEHQRAGAEYITRDSPLENEEALLEEHARLEETFKAPVVLWDWKRID